MGEFQTASTKGVRVRCFVLCPKNAQCLRDNYDRHSAHLREPAPTEIGASYPHYYETQSGTKSPASWGRK